MGLFEECHHCTKRVVGCHSKCEEYAEASKKNEKIRAARNADSDCASYLYGVKMDYMAKRAMKKKHHITYKRNM